MKECKAEVGRKCHCESESEEAVETTKHALISRLNACQRRCAGVVIYVDFCFSKTAAFSRNSVRSCRFSSSRNVGVN